MRGVPLAGEALGVIESVRSLLEAQAPWRIREVPWRGPQSQHQFTLRKKSRHRTILQEGTRALTDDPLD